MRRRDLPPIWTRTPLSSRELGWNIGCVAIFLVGAIVESALRPRLIGAVIMAIGILGCIALSAFHYFRERL